MAQQKPDGRMELEQYKVTLSQGDLRKYEKKKKRISDLVKAGEQMFTEKYFDTIRDTCLKKFSAKSCDFTADFQRSIKNTTFQSRAMIRAIQDFRKIFPSETRVLGYIEAKYTIAKEPKIKTCEFFINNLKYLHDECVKRANNTWTL